MNKISEVANGYLQNKGTINEEFGKLNVKTLIQKKRTMKELTKMIDNTKKIKEFYETLFIRIFLNYFITKQAELNEVIEKVNIETGLDKLDKLSSDL